MQRIPAQSAQAAAALAQVSRLQQQLVSRLEDYGRSQGAPQSFVDVEWFRDGGRHGGGMRYEIGENRAFNRASVNLSQVQYDDAPERQLGSATALSSIIHPRHPLAPSLHLHLSWTELKHGKGYWRIMADLNPATDRQGLRETFEACLRQAAPDQSDQALAQGDKYFYIPRLQRHRGVCHFYLEAYDTGDFAADSALAENVALAVIESYRELLAQSAALRPVGTDYARQLAYHTLYFFQVLTLDRGTTSGLLVHDQNDAGILGSLPAHIDTQLLAQWQQGLPEPQDKLLADLLAVLPAGNPCPIELGTKLKLAEAVRAHYRRYPEALELQARGEVIPPTVSNHSTPA